VLIGLAGHFFFSRCDSRGFRAHYSQQTATVREPILTFIAFSSSLQSQAAQVFSGHGLIFSNVPTTGHA
jgi:hypothetical protein